MHGQLWAKIAGLLLSVGVGYHNCRHNLGAVLISSFAEFVMKKAKLKTDNPKKNITVWATSLCFNKYFDGRLDAFEICIFDSSFSISGNLKKLLLMSKFPDVI